MDDLEPWELGVLGIYDYQTGGPYEPYFDFLRRNSGALMGDAVEFGVFKGRTLLAAALLLRELGSQKAVVGFDSFSGFPSYSPQDDFQNFERLYRQGSIANDHWIRIQKNKSYLERLGRSVDPARSSSSGDFSDTALSLVKAKIEVLNLDRVSLVPGDFAITLSDDYPLSDSLPESLCSAFIDCDLYAGYRAALPWVWDRLVDGGMIFLDEYYSLKFPGPRIAVDEFCLQVRAKPQLISEGLGWERWVLCRV